MATLGPYAPPGLDRHAAAGDTLPPSGDAGVQWRTGEVEKVTPEEARIARVGVLYGPGLTAKLLLAWLHLYVAVWGPVVRRGEEKDRPGKEH